MKRKTTQIRKGEIVKSAQNLMIKQGIKGITIKNLAKMNRISEGAIYRHYDSKRSILLALVDDFEKNLMEAINTTINKYEDPIEILKNIKLVHMKYSEERRAELFAITAASIHFNDDILRRKILGVIEKYKTSIKTILVKAQNKKLIRNDLDLDSVSLTFFGLIQTAIIQYALTNYKVPPVTKFSTLWEIFLRGILRN